MNCPACGKPNAAEHRFCLNCGAQLHSSQTSPSSGYAATMADVVIRHDQRTADLMVGRTIEGRYRLDAKLGVGGMGAVFVATRLHIGDTVAVKVLLQEQLGVPEAVARFRREAQIAARLKHPNAVSIYDFGISSEGLMYIVMELVEGHSLRQIIKQQGTIEAAAVTEITGQVCSALDEAHRQNIVHRDIKPDNIIVYHSAGGLRVKVLDFGIAKLREATAGNLTLAGTVMGTPYYMSPEQCLGEEIDCRSDIYSLGIVLYEMLCGVVPFNSPTPTAVVVQHVTQAPPMLRSVVAGIPPAVESVVLRALEKRREARPQTAGALSEELKAAIRGASHTSQSGVKTPASVPAVTAASLAVSTSAVLPPTAASTPVSESLSVVTSETPQYASGAVAPGGRRSKLLLPLLIGGLLLLILGGAGIGGIVWWLRASGGSEVNKDQRRQNEQQKQSGQDQATQNSIPSPSPTVTSTNDPADEEFASLSQRLANSTPAERLDIVEALKAAEEKFPNDYRFTYEGAKVSIAGAHAHHDAFEHLFLAGRKAIENNKADEMLSDLMRDKDTELHRLSSGHNEWNVLVNALRSKDASALTSGIHD